MSGVPGISQTAARRALSLPGSRPSHCSTLEGDVKSRHVATSRTEPTGAPGSNELGAFLRTRRQRINPSTYGLHAVGSRRTPGLRREELAGLAGISVEYLIRLERGRDRNPSAAVVEALARVLQLDDDETSHLARLANIRLEPTSAGDVVADDVLRLIEHWPTPTLVTNQYLDLLATNRPGRALHDGIGLHDGDNMLRELFVSPRARHIYVDYDDITREAVANLRSLAGSDPGDPRLVALVGELSVANPLFAKLWARADVRGKSSGRKRIRHHTAGLLELEWTTLQVTGAPGQLVVAYQPVPDTRATRVLADWADTPTR